MPLAALALVLAYVAVIAALVWGWVLNVVSLVGMLDGGITSLLVVRIAGVFFIPLGAVLGFAA
jgi:hypothetical protein